MRKISTASLGIDNYFIQGNVILILKNWRRAIEATFYSKWFTF